MRNSEKRDAILDCLRGTRTHPTAEWIYRQLNPDYPRLSLATVYRNLNQLKDAGLVRSVGIVDGMERFDGNVAPHPHVVCSRCGKVVDLLAEDMPAELALRIEKLTGFLADVADTRLTGVCQDCLKKENSNPTE